MNGLSFTTKQLDAVSGDVHEIAKLSSNIGDFGYAPDFSKNTLRNPIQNDFPLLTWLLNTSMSTMIRNASNQGLAQIHKDAETGQWMLMLPYSVYTLPPEDTTGACCWVPFDLAKCGDRVPLKLLCLKDCDSIFDNLVNQRRYPNSNDLTNYFLQQGESVKAARTRMAKMSMAYFTAKNVILGLSDAGTNVLKPFHGLLEVMEGEDVIKIFGANVLGAFDTLMCRLLLLGDGDYVVGLHPLTYQGIANMVQPDRFGRYPEGWTKNGNTLTFNNIRFIPDKSVPVDLDSGTGEAWVLDGQTTGAYLATNLYVADDFKRHGFTSTDNPDEGCASECDFYYNFGAAFNNNSNRLAVITDIPLSANCALGTGLQGLDNLVQPDTLVPFT